MVPKIHLILETNSREEMQEGGTRKSQAEMLQCNVISKELAHLEKAGNQKYRGELIQYV